MTKKQGDTKVVTQRHNETLPSLQFYRLTAFDFDFKPAVLHKSIFCITQFESFTLHTTYKHRGPKTHKMNPRMNKGWAYKNTLKRNSTYDDFGVYLVLFIKFFLTLFLLNFHVRAQAYRRISLSSDKKNRQPSVEKFYRTKKFLYI